MNLNRVAKKLHRTPIRFWDREASEWINTGVTGRLEVYDRFLADRSFGQRKRNLLTDPENTIPADVTLIRVGDLTHPYMVESRNHDATGQGSHLVTHTLHHAPLKIDVYRQTGSQRPSGAVGDPKLELVDTTWGNCDRYGDTNARGGLGTSFTVMSVYMPRDVKIDGDCLLKVDGEMLSIKEISPQLGIRLVRAQKWG